jgi:rhodanese-related sulfurtransferase
VAYLCGIISQNQNNMNLEQIIREQNPDIIDVRETYEFAEGHIHNAVNIPLGNIPAHVDRFREAGKPIIFYCRSGGRSGQAVAFLQSVGVKDIYNGGGLGEMMAITGVNA